MIKLFITDLDDTLYPWLEFFVPAFYDMAEEVSKIVGVPEDQLLEEYRLVHQQKKSVEYPRATLLLPSVQKKYGNLPIEEQLTHLDSAFHKFNSKRKKLLVLYPGVKNALDFLIKENVTIVGYTESSEENGFYRLKKLDIAHYFKEIYVSDSSYQKPDYIPASPKTHVVHGKKPNPKLIQQICAQESASYSETLYMGDSLTKDILMAKQAGVYSVWVDIPVQNSELYSKLVKISHWTKEDFDQEKKNKLIWQSSGYIPDYTIHSFDELPQIIMAQNR